uniref:Cohesin-associated protein pds5 n=2 Tax=Moniliophthora roreri TaxID=221103 RepID=A0A0W0GEX7_MONRR
MPSTRQRASEGHQPSPGKTRLSFREKLVQKGSSTDAVLKKLKALHTELAEMDQELVDVTSLSNVKKDLITHHILHHKDRGVRAYAACCLADILRLYAPDAPFTQPELRDIFQFFFRQLSTGMKSGPESAYYDQYFHLLESLSTVKSVVLVCDLPNADEVMTDIFKDFFALVRSNFAKKIELFMADILVAIIDEAQTIPENLLDLILAQFMDKDAKIEQPAYRLAVQVCNETSDKLQRHVSLYFSEILLSHTQDETEAAEDKNIRSAHELIKRLHASCPGLLHSVIPQLEEELQMSSPHLRGLAVQALGDMFGDKNGGELWKNFPSTWQAWLSRGNDKSTVVRLKFVESSKGLYSSTSVEMREALENLLNVKLLDPEEKVRAAVCKLYSELDYETAAHHVSMKQLEAVIARVADRKVVVRHEAAMSIAKLYNLAQPEIENNDPIAVEKFSWIPGKLIGMVNLTECRPVIERAFAEHILPLPSSSGKNSTSPEVDEVAWTNRLLGTICYVPEKLLQQGFLHLTGLRSVHPTSYEVYIDTCIANNGGIIDENEELITKRLRGIIQVISAQFPDPIKTSEDLNTFAKNNDKRLYKLLKTACSVDTDLKSLIKATSEFSKRIDTGLLPTFKTFLYKASLRAVNTSSVPTLLKAIQHPYQNQNRRSTNARTKSIQAAEHAKLILQWISKFCPALYKPHVERLVEVVKDEGEAEGEGGMVEAGLQALAAVVRVDPTLAPHEKETIARTRELALSGSWRHAKFATRFLAFCEDEENEGVCGALAEEIAESLDLADESRLVAHVTALDQLVQFAPNAFESKSDVITKFLLKKLLMVPNPSPDDDMDDGEEWCEDAVLPDLTRAKVTALKVFRHRSLSHKDKPNALELSTPVLKMLAMLLDQEGTLATDADQDRKVLSRMRLQAAVSLVHLSTVERYADALVPKFLKLTLIIQDACFEVRLGFVQKLVNLMALHRLPDRFYVIPFLTAHDPEEEVKRYAMTYVTSQLRRVSPTMRVKYFDMIFIRLLHLLAHHPDYPEVITKNTLSDISLYIVFYVDLVANQDTVSLLYHLAMKGKTVQDAEGDPYSENLYVLCEIAQELLKARAHQKGWNVTSYPGKVKLPSDILRPLPSAEVVNKVVKTTYLPEEAGPWVKELVEPQKEKRERKAPKRRAPAATSNGQAKRSRKRKRRSAMSDDDGEEDAVSSDVDVEMADVRTSSPEPDGQEEERSGDEEELGRGARGRAKAKAKRKAQTKTKAQKTKEKAKDDSPPLSPLSDE